MALINNSVLVVGAGAVGLTAALEAQRAGMLVTVVSDPDERATCTLNSGAIWGPFLTEQRGRASRWSDETYEELSRISAEADSGVTMTRGKAIDLDPPTEIPWWVESFPGSVANSRARGHREWNLTIPVIDPEAYLAYLMREFELGGGIMLRRRVARLSEFVGHYGHIVVSAGLGTSALVEDRALRPSRGQLVVVENPGITEFTSIRGDGPDLTYIIPQGKIAILGGTAEFGSADANPSERTTRAIIKRCAVFEPDLVAARILGTRVGIRPYRSKVRVEHLGDSHMVMNYGHGGSGLSISWGSARLVRDLIIRCNSVA